MHGRTLGNVGHEHQDEAVDERVDNTVLGAAALIRASARNADDEEEYAGGGAQKRNELDQALNLNLNKERSVSMCSFCHPSFHSPLA